MKTPPTRRGRPVKDPANAERVPLGLRVSPEMKQKLDDAARRSSRSQSQEAELRLEQSFEREQILERLDAIEASLRALAVKL